LYAFLFFAVFMLNFVFTYAREREDVALKQTVRDLRARARQQEEEFRDEMKVGVGEVLRRLQALRQEGMLLFLKWLTPPSDFLEEEPQP